MARLTAAKRKRIKTKDFAGPGRSYPVEDKAHATAALRLVGRGVKAGNISEAQAAKIRAKARAKLGKPKRSKG
jgi:hypothetical protein